MTHMSNKPRHDRKILLNVADGPEYITLYTSVDEAVVDCANEVPGLYLEAGCGLNCSVKLGPFSCSSVLKQLLDFVQAKGSRA